MVAKKYNSVQERKNANSENQKKFRLRQKEKLGDTDYKLQKATEQKRRYDNKKKKESE